MFSKTLAECFPHEDLPRLYSCANIHCFYHEVLMKMDEVNWKDKWSGEELEPKPSCPSCGCDLEIWKDA